MKQILLQITLDTEANQLQLGLAEGISSEDREYIIATMELVGNKILSSMKKTEVKDGE